ncbi:MAG TPA: hypothetical protein VEU73_05330 [Gemmatimonadales bacterium]|nr:hypothetical protein [Gemmatimonadales bacterium]
MYPSRSVARRGWAAVLLVMTVSGVGCQAWHVQRIAPESLLATQPRTILVTRTDGSRVVLEGPVLRSDTMSGLVADKREGQQQVSIPIADIQQVATPRFSVERTFGLFAGLGVLVLATIAITFAIACSGGQCD